MPISKSIFETAALVSSATRVARGLPKVISTDLSRWWDSLFVRAQTEACDASKPMWEQARELSWRARESEKTGTRKAKGLMKLQKRAFLTAATQCGYSTRSSRFYLTKTTPYVEDTVKRKRPARTKNVKPKVVGMAAVKEFEMSQSEIPSSRLARIFHYGSLAAGMGIGAATHGIKHYALGNKSELTMKLMFLSPANIERMARKFSQMRGAALKLGQMMSFQDLSILPVEIQQILLRVQNNAHYMPPGQLYRVMAAELGLDWRKKHFAKFDDVPFAAASIGQVHHAVTTDLVPVVVKVQYPGVSDSIDSDLNNLLLLLTALSILPKGLFLDKTIANARVELKWECDYIREAQNLIRFRELMADDPVFEVPRVLHQMCGEHVLTMERMRGVEIAKGDWDQDTKNWIATNIMRLCLLELKEFKFMQTDPNWANFLYNEETKKIELLDFGASREFADQFVDDYVEVLRAAVKKDRVQVEEYSKRLGYLTGLESPQMIRAHVDSVMVLGEAFAPQPNDAAFDFRQQTITDRVRGNIGLMLNERLTPPPEETYSLHRKLSGVYLLCAKLNATVPCAKLFKDIIGY